MLIRILSGLYFLLTNAYYKDLNIERYCSFVFLLHFVPSEPKEALSVFHPTYSNMTRRPRRR